MTKKGITLYLTWESYDAAKRAGLKPSVIADEAIACAVAKAQRPPMAMTAPKSKRELEAEKTLTDAQAKKEAELKEANFKLRLEPYVQFYRTHNNRANGQWSKDRAARAYWLVESAKTLEVDPVCLESMLDAATTWRKKRGQK